jgi:hypothetical protein
MKLNIGNDVEKDEELIEINSDTGGEINLKKNNNNAKIFFMLFEGLYSNPIGSIVRELVSNAVDAHTEAGVTDIPVVVGLEYNYDSGWEFTVVDYGVGISDDRFLNIYAVPTESTKDDSNDLIGGWGIGSKTPFSYKDDFILHTCCEGKERIYAIYRDFENGLRWSLLHSDDNSTMHNGTIVKLQIKESDHYKFVSECIKQLAYFPNIQFRNISYDEDYKIYTGKYFKFRTKEDIYSNKLHLIIGNVPYTINYEELGYVTYKDVELKNIELPIGVTFNIGELPITPSRENIKYDNSKNNENDKTKDLIKERIVLALDEIISKDSNLIYGNFFNYILNFQNNDKSKFITLNKEDLDSRIEITDYNHLNPLIPEPKFHKFKDFPVSLYDRNSLKNFFNKEFRIYDNTVYSKTLSKWRLRRIFERKSSNLAYYFNTIRSVTIYDRNYFEDTDIYRFNLNWSSLKRIFTFPRDYVGKSKFYIELLKVIKEDALELNHKEFNSFEIPKEWKNNFDLQRNVRVRFNTTKVKREKHIIPVRDIVTEQNIEIDTSTFNYTGILVYGTLKEKDALIECKKFLYRINFNQKKNIPPYKVYRIAENNKKHFKNMPNAIDINYFNNENNDLLINTATARTIRNSMLYLRVVNALNSEFNDVNPEIYKKLVELENFINKYDIYYEKIVNDFIALYPNKKNNQIMETFEVCFNYFKEFLFLDKDLNSFETKELAALLILFKKPVSYIYKHSQSHIIEREVKIDQLNMLNFQCIPDNTLTNPYYHGNA